ncbi:MAG: hypothetical protein U9P44_02055, partial [archaeon]|nr:hypothetical protein [archaeon]
LTTWVTQFTESQQKESEKYQEKIECSGSNFIANRDFVRLIDTADSYNLTTRLENIGFNLIVIRKIQVWYADRTLPEYLNFDPLFISEDEDLKINIDLYDTESGKLEPETVGGLEKIKFISTCDGVWYILDKPHGGWNFEE